MAGHYRIVMPRLEMTRLAGRSETDHFDVMSIHSSVGRLAAFSIVLGIVGCGVAGPDVAQVRRDALAQVIAVERAFAAFAADSTVQQAFTRFIGSGGILFRPGPVDGEGALAAQPMADAVALIWEPAFADASEAGDLGYTTGPWRAGARGTSPDSLPGAGQYVTMWRRTPEGFRYVLDVGIVHDPSLVREPETVLEADLPAARVPAEVLDPDQARESLMIADQDLGQALAAGDPAAYRAYATASVRVLRDGGAPTFGPDALIAAAPLFAVETEPEDGIVAASNDLGYTFGSARPAGDAESGPVGYYLRIWRRQADGSWELVLDLVTFPPS